MASTLQCEAPGCGAAKTAKTQGEALRMLELHNRNVHPPQPVQAAPGMDKRGRKINRPNMGENDSDEAWIQFKYNWGNYRKYHGITDRVMLNLELQQCCDKKLRLKLTQDPDGEVNELDEEQLLARIK